MLLGPAGMPAAVAQRLSDAMTAVLGEAEISEKAIKLGFEVDPSGPRTPPQRRRSSRPSMTIQAARSSRWAESPSELRPTGVIIGIYVECRARIYIIFIVASVS